MRKAILALLCACAAATPAAYAQDMTVASGEDARVAAARTLLDLNGYEQQLDYMFEKLVPLFSQGVIGILQADPASKAMTDQLIATGKGGQGRLVAILGEEFRRSIRAQYPNMNESTAREYAAAFTLDDLTAITTFYRSPAGAKSLQVLPQLQDKIGAAAEQYGKIAGEQAGRRAFERAIQEMLPQSGKAKL